ncbi:DUF4129 domain-containing protein [Dactylosporangium vinaceum]|uniref:DUF4129 domain-containing protein n=1 Tax=Dactylosporangium vinaceum TaxID=53362 RepID=A0ABV5LYC5_9ACTN|nr:DUF4129 domain-containing protein [Dactylosporangium vinaceum]UAB95856.1 DUF4129 domain-containing protein [Dactylosporangium vinaceum]
MDRTFGRWLPVLGVIAVLLIGGLAASMSSPEITRVPVPGPAVPEPTPSVLAPEHQDVPEPAGDSNTDGGGGLPDWAILGGTLLCGALVLALVGSLIWFLVTNRSTKQKPRIFVEPEAPRPMVQGSAEEVMAAVEAGIVELSDTDTDPRRAVIACWVRLERAAAAAGTPRLTGDSPTELVTRLLSAHQVSRPTLEGFAEVYREARYATHPVGERSRQDAIGALRQIRTELAGQAAGAAPPVGGERRAP